MLHVLFLILFRRLGGARDYFAANLGGKPQGPANDGDDPPQSHARSREGRVEPQVAAVALPPRHYRSLPAVAALG
jgi:hypothetical protein